MQLSFDYSKAPILARYLKSKALGSFIIGPVGSGKTAASILKLLMVASNQAPAQDGYRHTRFAIVRNTLSQLKTTVLKDIEMMLSPIVHFKVSDNTIYINQGDIKSEWILIPLDNVEDQRRLLSTQLTAAYINEFREVAYDLIPPLLGRLGRYPSKLQGGPTWFGLIGDSNPFSVASEWYDHLVAEPPPNFVMFKQPGGMDKDGAINPDAENLENLPPDYYHNLAAGQPEAWVKVHVRGEYGDDMSGQTVFKDSFTYDWHVVEEDLEPIRGHPLIVGLDFGRTPACVLMQIDPMARCSVFDEITTEGMGLESFLVERLTPKLSTDRFYGLPVFIVADPAGTAKSQLSEESAFDVLKRLGFSAIPASTNDVEPRLRVVEKWLMRAVQGRPAFRVDPRAGVLIKSLASEYKYKRLKTGRVEDKPDKTHPYSDIVDALGYGLLGADSGYVARRMERSRQKGRENAKPRFTARAWT